MQKSCLGELGFDRNVSERVQYLIAHHHTYGNINEMDYQILVEADFLVNIMEEGSSKEAGYKSLSEYFQNCHAGRRFAGRCLVFDSTLKEID